MKKIILLTCFVFIFTGCSLKGLFPSDCDEVTEYSLLCDLADRLNTRIEDMGNSLIIVNSVLIGEGVYTKEQALEVAFNMKSFLKNPVTWLAFGDELRASTEKYPGLYDISELYIAEFVKTPRIIGGFDRDHLIGFFEKIESILLK